MRRMIAVSAVILWALTAGCNISIVEGSGNAVTEDRDVSGFDSVSLSWTGELTIRQTGVESLTVIADDNLIEHIVTEVRGGELRIGMSPEFHRAIVRPSTPVRYELTVKDLNSIAISGSGTVRAQALASDAMSIAVSGSGNVEVSELSTGAVAIAISGSGNVDLDGTTETQTVSISGSGEYEGDGLVSEATSVSVSGSGDVVVHASQRLSAHVSGSGSVRYRGDPEVESRVSGSGSVRRLGGGRSEA